MFCYFFFTMNFVKDNSMTYEWRPVRGSLNPITEAWGSKIFLCVIHWTQRSSKIRTRKQTQPQHLEEEEDPRAHTTSASTAGWHRKMSHLWDWELAPQRQNIPYHSIPIYQTPLTRILTHSQEDTGFSTSLDIYLFPSAILTTCPEFNLVQYCQVNSKILLHSIQETNTSRNNEKNKGFMYILKCVHGKGILDMTEGMDPLSSWALVPTASLCLCLACL